MNGAKLSWTVGKRLRSKLNRIVQTKLWGMDIHPSAQVDPTALVDRTWPKGVHIEADCRIAEHVVLLTHDLTRGLYLDTRIGQGTYVGPRAIILPGITVGKNCIIMPGALVRTDVPDGSVAIGNPAVISARQAEPLPA